jgi:hypothetical protein
MEGGRRRGQKPQQQGTNVAPDLPQWNSKLSFSAQKHQASSITVRSARAARLQQHQLDGTQCAGKPLLNTHNTTSKLLAAGRWWPAQDAWAGAAAPRAACRRWR